MVEAIGTYLETEMSLGSFEYFTDETWNQHTIPTRNNDVDQTQNDSWLKRALRFIGPQ